MSKSEVTLEQEWLALNVITKLDNAIRLLERDMAAAERERP